MKQLLTPADVPALFLYINALLLVILLQELYAWPDWLRWVLTLCLAGLFACRNMTREHE